MTRDELIKMAREAGAGHSFRFSGNNIRRSVYRFHNTELERFAELVAAAERKREWRGLTEEQRSEAIDSVPANNIGGEYYYEEVEQVAKIIEAQLKEQNT
jgi:hypothetical protein